MSRTDEASGRVLLPASSMFIPQHPYFPNASLRDALAKVLDTRSRYAKTTMSYQNARENFSDSTDERKAHERAMLAASEAELQARTLLLTLRA